MMRSSRARSPAAGFMALVPSMQCPGRKAPVGTIADAAGGVNPGATKLPAATGGGGRICGRRDCGRRPPAVNLRKLSPAPRSSNGSLRSPGIAAMTPTVLALTAVLFAADPAPDAKPMRKPHPLAPSLPELTKEEEEKLDDIINRFIRADTGQLQG